MTLAPFVRPTLLLGALALVACGKGRTETWSQTPTVAAASVPAIGDEPGAEGDGLWARRDERPQLEAALAAWERALASKPEDSATLVKLARGTYFLADAHMRADKETYLKTFEKGVDYAERALAAVSPEFKARMKAEEPVKDAVESVGVAGVAALYWYSSNLGKWARAKGFATTLGNKDTIKAVMSRCLTLDPTYFYGGPDRYFGAFYAVAPSFAGGDLAKSEEHFNKSLSIAPFYLATKVLMAENLAVKRQDKELFKKLLDEVLAAPEDGIAELVPESRVEKQKARELLAQIDEKF